MSTTFNRTRNDLIRGALRVIGALASGETPSDSEIDDGEEALNIMAKSWVVDGAHLWTQTQATLFCAPGQREYSLPGANATKTYIETALAVVGVATDNTLIVDSTAGINNGNFIGILLDDRSIHWSTVVGVFAGNSVNISPALPSGAAVGNQVYAYTTKIERPLRIYNMRRQNLDGTEIQFNYDGYPLARNEYLQLPNKIVSGFPIQGWYDPQLTTGKLFIWPAPIDSTIKISFTYERMIEDFNDIGDFPDFPQEWLNALKWNLAVELAPEYEIVPSQFIIETARELKLNVLSWDRDMGSLFVAPACQ